MHAQIKTDTWIYYLRIVLGLTITVSILGTIALLLFGQSISEILLALGTVAGAGLVNLLISPLNRELFG